ncbi:ABC transporter substrate-binding protein [Methylobacterium sp. Leaf111]|uniref:ABC transporter substrate-binding protein n=1 Tax=Methylobacterium sp. Leaf111 TaxID=1736257 RepID=UPI0009E94897|nr:ABC transporter substrate-binding protein [Methylobacterium sp. Leaf111]
MRNISFFLASCVLLIGIGGARSQTPPPKVKFNFAYKGDLKSLDPYTLKESFAIAMHSAVYETLISRDKDLRIAPGLAESWETLEPTRWRFKLRRNVKFHDGADFTADDVIFSATRVRAPGSNFKTNIPEDAEFVKVDDHTVDMLLKKPNPIAINQFNSWFIMSKTWSEKNSSTTPAAVGATTSNHATLNANGTGPFSVSEHLPGVRTVFKRNASYWDKIDSNLDEATLHTIENDATRVAALLSGDVDWIDPVPSQDVQRIQSSGKAVVLAGPELRTIYIGMDQYRDELKYSDVMGSNPFKDIRVREAFFRAIDEDAIVNKVMRGDATATALLIAPSLYSRSTEFKRPGHDPLRAKALLSEAGFPNGFSLVMDCASDRYVNGEAICQAVVSMLSRVGIKITLNSQPKAKFFTKVLAPAYDTSFYLLSWMPSSLDAHNVLYEVMGCRMGTTGGRGSWNVGNYCNPNLDKITDTIELETDISKRDALIKDAFQTIISDWGVIPLHQQSIAWGVSKNVSLVQRPDNELLLYWVVKKNEM